MHCTALHIVRAARQRNAGVCSVMYPELRHAMSIHTLYVYFLHASMVTPVETVRRFLLFGQW